jgi:uncharacterized protein (TIGR02118 family)
MYRVSVCYGQPADTAAFDAYYANIHVPLTLKVPHLESFTTGRCESVGRSERPYYLVAHLGFKSANALKEALGSPEMAAAGADMRNFATGGAVMFGFDEDVLR